MGERADRRLTIVAAAVIVRDGRVLIAKRPAGAHLEGLWEFPGGKAEPGETVAACLDREIMEELGTTIATEGEGPWRIVHHDYPGKPVEIHFFRCRLTGPEPRAIDASDIAWVGAADLGRYEFPAADAGIIAELPSLLDAAGPDRP